MLRTLAQTRLRLFEVAYRRALSTVRIVPPSSSRQLALPLCWLALQGWDHTPASSWDLWIDRFAAKGYASLVLDVDPACASAESTTEGRLSKLEQELVRLLRDPAASSPFPPLLFASSASALLAETYVSSHPLSGLCLISPTVAPLAHSTRPDAFPTPLNDFNYEPGFPIAVMAPEARQVEEHRLVRDYGPQEGEDEEDALVRRIIGERNEQGWERVMQWMDDNGL